MNEHFVVLMGIAVGFFVVPALASQPGLTEIVNGILLLLLLGALLVNSKQWLPAFNAFGNAINTSPTGLAAKPGAAQTQSGSGTQGYVPSL